MAKKKRTVAQLKAAVAAGYAARNELQARQEAINNRKNAGLVGQWQKYRNSYGSDENWWLYRRILSVSGQWCKSFAFQITSNNTMEIDLCKHGSLDSGGWLPVAPVEVQEAWATAMDLAAQGYASTKRED